MNDKASMKKFFLNSLYILTVSVGTIFSFSTCSTSEPDNPSGGNEPEVDSKVAVKGVWLSSIALLLGEGTTVTLTAMVTPSDATDNSVEWSTSDANVVTVDQNGKVTAIGKGKATVTVTTRDQGKTASCAISVTLGEAVDLGLSVKWSSCNLGATKLEEYGDYFAWGETQPYCRGPLFWDRGKSGYNWASYKWCNSSDESMTKYNTEDNKIVLDPLDDAASAILGGKWRTPTDAEWTELRDNCTWSWTSNYKGTGVAGRIVTSNKSGYTDKSIFLPAAGHWFNLDYLKAGTIGYYWSSSRYTDYPTYAWYVYFSSDNVTRRSTSRYCGYSLRPVIE